MNFKAFLKNNLISESTFLFEEDDVQQQKKTFIQSAYRRVYPNGTETNTEKQWNMVRNKAYYHLTKGSKEETRKAVALAKSALNQAKARTEFKLDTENDKANDTRSTDDKIKSHLEDWGDSDLDGLKKAVSELGDGEFKSKATELIGDNVKSIDDLKNAISTISDENDKEQLLELIKGQETLSDEELGVKDWKDKTFEDLGSIKDEDFNKIKDNVKATLGVEDGVKLDTIEDLKEYLKDKPLNPEKLQELDKLLVDDGGATPPVQTQQKPQVPQDPKEQNKVPVSTANQEILDNIQKKQQEAELNDHLKKLGLDITSLDTGDAEVVQKIIDSGDPLLYDTYIAKNLPEESEIVQRIKREEEERQQVQREALERRTDRFEELKKSGKVLAGIGVIFDVLASALSGKGTNFFETMAQKQTLAKGIAERITNQLSDQYEERISNEDSNHAKELDALKTNYDQRLKDLESQKADPSKTVAYKKLLTMASQKYRESMSELKAITQEASQRVADVSSLNVFMSTDDLSGLDPASKNQMTKVLSEKYPRQKIQNADGTETDESDDAYLERIKKEAKDDDIQRIVDEANNDLEQAKGKEKELDDVFNKSLEDLKQNPEVQDEMKLAEQTYKSQKAIIESEYKKAVATETTRYEKTVHCLRKTMDENKRFFKNISVLAMYSDNPQDIIIQEMASRNKKLQDRAKLETGTEIFNEENCPSDPKKLKEWFENASKGSEGKPKKGKDRDDDDDDGDDTPKKLTKPNGGQGDPGKTGADGGKEPDPDETKKKAKQTASESVNALKEKFKGKEKAMGRLKNFLKGQNIDIDLDQVDVNNLPDDQVEALNKALEEFKNQEFPKTAEECKQMGITTKDGKEITDDILKNLKPNEIKELKEMYGFDDDEGKAIPKKTEPITVKTDNLDEIKKLGLKLKDKDGKPLDLSNLDNDQWKGLLSDENINTQLETQLKSPEVLKQLSGEDATSEKTEIEKLTDAVQDAKTPLKEMNFKTLWTLLNNEGISIRALPGYKTDMKPEDKANLIRDYIKGHTDVQAWGSLITESKTSQKRLSSLIEANNKKIQKRSLKKFAELLVNDVRTFG